VPAHGRLGGLLREPAGFQEGHCGADEAGQLPVTMDPPPLTTKGPEKLEQMLAKYK
jgi:hypothetical protein